MSAEIRLAESSEPKIRLAPSTEPPVDPDAVARALGAESVGAPGPGPYFTFAEIRARVAAVIARRGQSAGPRVPLDVGPGLRASVDEITADLHATGTPATPSEVAQVLLEMSIEWSKKDPSMLVAKLRERAARSGGQPS